MIPVVATYRIQLHAGFTFDDAAAIAGYLGDLGISHVYCSPYLQAVRGSTHGYDVIDYGRPSLELGGDGGLGRFTGSLTAHGLGHVLDMVPNHMAIATSENRWWADVLENGPSSHFAAYFDVDWEPPEARLRNVVLLPVLGDHYGRVLDAGALTVSHDETRFFVHHAGERFPITANSLGPLLETAARKVQSNVLAYLADAFAELPRPTATDTKSVRRRLRDIAVLRDLLAHLLETSPAAAAAVDEAVATLNEDRDALHALLENQNYRLAWWRSAGHDLGYRRFFDINTLIGLRVEDDQVFDDTHRLVLEWVDQGLVDGLRIDHPDGLRDPQAYFDRLRRRAPRAWIVAEKILEPGEALPASWPVAGTTGYDFLNRVGGLFLDPAGERPLTDFYTDFTGETADYAHATRLGKLLVLREVLRSDVNRLTDLLLRICERHIRHRDYSRDQLAHALCEVVACFPVYRTYVVPDRKAITDVDRGHIESAIAGARAAGPDGDAPLFEFLCELLTLAVTGDLEAEFVLRFQQLTGPAMAKGVEDTVFYTYNRFIALNEVGGDPSHFGLAVDSFHDAAGRMQRSWPQTMVTTATHDTKRGEDLRMRLAVLSEQPKRWTAAVGRWTTMTREYRTAEWPDRNTEYFFYQAWVGAWPVEAGRLVAYMQKAVREAKRHTSWTSPNEEYEAAVAAFVERALGDAALSAEVAAFVEPLVRWGYVNSLAQVLVKLTAPGVPDVYQGTELWDFHFVDPDNRQPVDYDLRRRLLAEVRRMPASAIWARAGDGLPKLWVTTQALQLRKRRPGAFATDGTYAALHGTGPAASHVVGFVRGDDVITIVPRLSCTAAGTWDRTSVTIPHGNWVNVLTGGEQRSGTVPVSILWQDFPVALLERTGM